MNRRRILLAIAALGVAAPLARWGWLSMLNAPLRPVEEPELELTGPWLLEAGDVASGNDQG